jgi:tRNA nucleotidyltransferase (CCA-adding enzyme)
MQIMNSLKEILNSVSTNISLKKGEEINLRKMAKDVISKLKPLLKKETILIGGSLAKQTLINKSEQDIDIFIIFENEDSTKNLESLLKKSKINVEKVHGSRDYFQLRADDILIEFIPIVKIDKYKSNKNVTDFSPLHVTYINKKTTPSILEEIKLAKSFCESNNLYGAESYIQGFSGYALELLICHYTSFIKFLIGIQKDKFIDIEKCFKNEKEARREINQSKLTSPIILVDPTNKYRNVCAGLSNQGLDKLKLLAKNFLKSPSEEFFHLKKFNEEDYIARSKGLYIIKMEISTNKENKDVAGTKMKKFFSFFINSLNHRGQEVIYSEFIYSKGKRSQGFISFKFKKDVELKGPKKEMKEAIENFKKKRKEIYLSKGYFYTLDKFDIQKFLKHMKKVAIEMKVDFSLKKY